MIAITHTDCAALIGSTAFVVAMTMLVASDAPEAGCTDGRSCVAQRTSELQYIPACICHCWNSMVWFEHVQVVLWSCDLLDPFVESEPIEFIRSEADRTFLEHPQVSQLLVEVSCHDLLSGRSMSNSAFFHKGDFPLSAR
jgi:hypothetical protein